MAVTSSRARQTIAPSVSIVFILTIAVGFGKESWWICDMFANLRAHTALALLIMLPVHFYFGQRLLLCIVAAVLAATVATSVTGFPALPSSADSESQELTIVSYNLGHGQVNPSGLDNYIDDTDADVIVFLEYSHDWQKYLQKLEKHYPYYVSEPRTGPFGIALFSRLPLLDSAAAEFTETNIPFISATALVNERKITLLGVHMDWPIQFSTFATRNRQIEDVIAVLDASENTLSYAAIGISLRGPGGIEGPSRPGFTTPGSRTDYRRPGLPDSHRSEFLSTTASRQKVFGCARKPLDRGSNRTTVPSQRPFASLRAIDRRFCPRTAPSNRVTIGIRRHDGIATRLGRTRTKDGGSFRKSPHLLLGFQQRRPDLSPDLRRRSRECREYLQPPCAVAPIFA